MANYTVKEVAQKFGVSPHTIRFYDNEGLFPDIARDAHGARMFNEEQLDWLGVVLCLRSTGLSVQEIRHYIALCEKGDGTLRERYGIIQAQKRRAEAERDQIDKKLQVLDRKLSIYEAALAEKGL